MFALPEGFESRRRFPDRQRYAHVDALIHFIEMENGKRHGDRATHRLWLSSMSRHSNGRTSWLPEMLPRKPSTTKELPSMAAASCSFCTRRSGADALFSREASPQGSARRENVTVVGLDLPN